MKWLVQLTMRLPPLFKHIDISVCANRTLNLVLIFSKKHIFNPNKYNFDPFPLVYGILFCIWLSYGYFYKQHTSHWVYFYGYLLGGWQLKMWVQSEGNCWQQCRHTRRPCKKWGRKRPSYISDICVYNYYMAEER